MIQCLGLRDHTVKDKKTGQQVTKKREVFFEKGWRFDKVADVFNPTLLDRLVEKIPLEERYNLYFTVADCFEESGRKLREQWAIPFDIDKLDLIEGKEHETAIMAAHAACEALGIVYTDTPVVFSGNGVQLFIILDHPITDESYFDSARTSYGVLAKRIQGRLNDKGIQGEVDASVWSKARLMRLPHTYNKKPGKPTRRAHILNSGAKAIPYDIVDRSGVALVKRGEYIPDEVLKNYPKPDTKAVLDGCLFLKFCDENAATISEPQWYADTSIRARLDEGDRLVHETSSKYPGYNAYETDNKIEQALAAAGPRTCKDIEARWEGCSACAFFGKITSPIMIKGPEYIQSDDFGFRERKVNAKTGVVSPGRVLHGDLKKQFALEHVYKVVKDTEQVIVYRETHWEYITPVEIRAWCMSKVQPEPSVVEMNEFFGQLKAHNITSQDELLRTRDGYINFSNVVLNIRTGVTYRHNPDFGFFDVRPFNYDARAKAPVWDKFILDIMSDSPEKAQLLKEFAGYCISGDYPWLQKAMMLVGSGSNGKSLFIETLGEVVGNKAYTAIPIQELGNPTMRFGLINKSFNYSEETSIRAFADANVFKTIVTGGELPVKQLYVQPYTAKITAKLMIACNELPATSDVTHGFTRRLAIVNFDEKFTPGDDRFDPNLRDKLRQEIPGICNSILKAYNECKVRGTLLHVQEVQDTLDQYMEENDSVLQFFHDVLVPEKAAMLKISEAFEEYKIMCERDMLRPKSAVWFGRDLVKLTHRNTRTTSARGSRVRVLDGYKINKDY